MTLLGALSRRTPILGVVGEKLNPSDQPVRKKGLPSLISALSAYNSPTVLPDILKATINRRNPTRKAFLLLAVLGLTSSLWAADPIIGTWKLNVEKSKMLDEARGALKSSIKEITNIYSETDSGLIELRTKRVFVDGTSDSDLIIFPVQGGEAKSHIFQDISMFEIIFAPGEWCGVYIQDGKQILTRHKVSSVDGNTFKQKLRGADNKEPFEVLEVFDRQYPRGRLR